MANRLNKIKSNVETNQEVNINQEVETTQTNQELETNIKEVKVNKVKTNTKTAKILDYFKKNKNEDVELIYGDCKIKVNKNISINDRNSMINEICNIVIDDRDVYKVENIHPEYKFYAKNCAIITYFTDLLLPENIDDLNYLITNTTIASDVYELNKEEIDGIFAETEEVLKIYTDTAISGQKFEELTEIVSEFANKMQEKVKGIDANQINDVLMKLKDVNKENVISAILKNDK